MNNFNNDNQVPPVKKVVVLAPTKSVGIAIILTILLGPFGMFYSTILGGIIMTLISAIVFFFTFGIGVMFLWPIYIVWAALAAYYYNKRLLRGTGCNVI